MKKEELQQRIYEYESFMSDNNLFKKDFDEWWKRNIISGKATEVKNEWTIKRKEIWIIWPSY